jgi:hypothetical protein
MPDIAALQVSVSAETRDLEAGLNRASQHVNAFGGDMQAAAVKAAGGFDGIAKAAGSVVGALGQIGLAAMGIRELGNVAADVGNAFGVGVLNEMEQTRASFQAFTKDAGKTEEILALVRKEAALTPFAFGEMAKATASLMPVAKSSGAALMDLVKEAEILAASNPLEGLEGASFSLREAMTGDFTSIIERFNLSRSTINKLKSKGSRPWRSSAGRCRKWASTAI